MNGKNLSEIKIEDLIPHRGRMALIDEIVEFEKEYAITSSTVNNSWPLLSARGVNPLIIVEVSAQSAGVCNGWDRVQNQDTESENMGWLVGVKRASFYTDIIPLHSTIFTRSENSNKYDNLRITSSILRIDNEIIGEIILQLLRAPQNDF